MKKPVYQAPFAQIVELNVEASVCQLGSPTDVSILGFAAEAEDIDFGLVEY